MHVIRAKPIPNAFFFWFHVTADIKKPLEEKMLKKAGKNIETRKKEKKKKRI